MKRDMDLIRAILLDIEEKDKGKGYNKEPEIPGYSLKEIEYHCMIMGEAELIRYSPYKGGYVVSRMTWQGHEFQALSSNNNVWEKTKKTLLDKGIDFTFDIGVKLLTRYTNELLGA